MSPALCRLINLSGENILIILALFFFVLPNVLNAVWITTPHPQQEEDARTGVGIILSLQISQVAELLMSPRITARLV